MARRTKAAQVSHDSSNEIQEAIKIDAQAAAEMKVAQIKEEVRNTWSTLQAAGQELKNVEPITNADAIQAPTPQMIVAAKGMGGTVTVVSPAKYNKKSVRVTGDNGKSYTLYHDAGKITHVWDDLDYKAERLNLYPMGAKGLIADFTKAEADFLAAIEKEKEAETELAIAKLEAHATWANDNLAAITIVPVGKAFTLTMTTNDGLPLVAIVTEDEGYLEATFSLDGQRTKSVGLRGFGLPTATVLAALAYELAPLA